MKITTEAGGVSLDFETPTARRCGGCTLCCKLLPIGALQKPSGTPCRHQRQGQGCRIYHRRPFECQSWSCRWLAAGDETAGMKRPDRVHYVIDPLFDIARITYTDQPTQEFDMLQVWVDPAFPAVAKDPALRAYMLKMAEQHHVGTLLRWSSRVATAVFPPPLNTEGQWHEETSNCSEEFGLWSKLPPGLRPPG